MANKFMEDYEEKLREKAENSAEQMKEAFKNSIPKERRELIKGFIDYYSKNPVGTIPSEWNSVQSAGALFGGVDDDDI